MKTLLAAALLTMGLTGAAMAGPVEDNIVKQLRDQGYIRISVSRTFLGRSRIVAHDGQIRREIVVNPVTGEILRDYWTRKAERGDFFLLDPKGWASGGNGEQYDDDDEDDDEDDYDDDDGDNENSGRGGGHSDSGEDDDRDDDDNSGRGSGNSGRGGDDDRDDDDNSGHGGGNDDDD